VKGILFVLGVVCTLPAAAQEGGAAELAKQLANPISSLISVPFQSNYDCCYGPAEGYRYTLNIQPVVPVSMNTDWNVIVRTIVPVVYQEEPAAGLGDEFGFSDVVQSFFVSPKLSKNGVTWGAGPVFLWPTGGEGLGTKKWGVGPTAVVLKQNGPTTVGFLANHIWSYAGEEDRADVSQTFLQPFYNYTYPDSTSVIIQTETTYDWKGEAWTVPLNAGIARVYTFGNQRVQLAGFGRVYLQRPDGGPDWGLRFNVTFLFPKSK
jgi:hypothetical protein